ncbi:MAG: ribonuclease P protein component [Planctomycetota bacterium]
MSDPGPATPNPTPNPTPTPTPSPLPDPSLHYRRRHRLCHDREFQAVYAAKARKSAGPLVVFMRPNGLPEPRLGLAVGRRVGPAHVRVRLKRLIREAFRLTQHELPVWPGDGGRYDVVVSIRPHGGRDGVRPLEQYRRRLHESVEHLHSVWTRRAPKDSDHA